MSESNLHEDRIAVLAYEYWLERGCPIGSPEVDWYRAVEALSAIETLSAAQDVPLAAFHAGPDTSAPGSTHNWHPYGVSLGARTHW